MGAEAGEGEAEDVVTLTLIIEDNGIGIAEEHRSGMGLLGMRERVQGLGGAMKVERRAEGGTRVIVSLPIRDEEGKRSRIGRQGGNSSDFREGQEATSGEFSG